MIVNIYFKYRYIEYKQNLFDLVIYVGDKRSYQAVQKKLRIPSIYNGYRVIDVYIENKHKAVEIRVTKK